MNLNLFATAIAEGTDAAAETTSGAGSMISMVIMIVVMVAIFYFLLIRPQKKKDKAVKNMLSALKVGDRICTIGGFYGTIAAIKDDNITLKMGSMENTIVVARWAIRGVENVKTENENTPEV